MDRRPLPGDLVLAHSKGAFSTLIRFGQWLRPSWRKWKKWNHAAIVVDVRANGIICAQMGRKGEIVHINAVAPGGYTEIRPMPAGLNRTKVVEYAKSCVGLKYSWLTIVSIAFNLLTPRAFHIDFRGDGNALICSALVARSWEHGGWSCPSFPYDITPCELARITEE